MAIIQFKGKVETVYNADNSIAYTRIKIPEFKRSHCDMAAFRSHPKYGSYANSDLFPNMLGRIRADLGNYIRLDRELPRNVTVNPEKFLYSVTVEV